jgi:hypothetical protein
MKGTPIFSRPRREGGRNRWAIEVSTSLSLPPQRGKNLKPTGEVEIYISL